MSITEAGRADAISDRFWHGLTSATGSLINNTADALISDSSPLAVLFTGCATA
uniref:Uncharacterized protein n=1 Tax=Erwinia amylovora ATCC BAA-2158 TaxID=889211 RepID=E5B7K7_ERWAM|nr:hypothetical protein predicted by Glimmer/Critica [Erwinia amylovora ATCC BAA-2158]